MNWLSKISLFLLLLPASQGGRFHVIGLETSSGVQRCLSPQTHACARLAKEWPIPVAVHWQALCLRPC